MLKQEPIPPHIRHSHLIFIIFLWIILLFLGWAALQDYSPPDDRMTYGVTFSHTYARDTFRMDWRASYQTILDDLGVRRLRVMSYWNEIEIMPDQFSFADLDFLMDEAAARNAEVILVVGNRQPRWPECHTPQWISPDAPDFSEKLFRLVSEVVNRYKTHPALAAWQVENEPTLRFFGECPPENLDVVRQEIALVRTLDPVHPILTTASGEFTSWNKSASLTPLIGISLYRVINNKIFGKIYYPVFPALYHWRAFFNKKADFFVSELQLEPWIINDITTTPLEEQLAQFDVSTFQKQITFAKKAGFDTQYLWGVEWWLWLKEQKNVPDLWDAARQLLKAYPPHASLSSPQR